MITQHKGVKFNVFFKGDIIDCDDTFYKRLIPQGSQFLLISEVEQGMKKWYRFNSFDPDEQQHVTSRRWDGCCFIPKKEVTVMGFAWYNMEEL